MEISKLSESAVKIKSKTAVFGINPVGAKAKVALDGAFFLQHTVSPETISAEEETLIVNGPGEYEVKGVKFTGHGKGEDISYSGRIDSMVVFVVKATALAKSKDAVQDCQVLLLEVDGPVEENLLAASNAQVAILFGNEAVSAAKQLGKEVSPVTKYVITRDKLPTETEIVVLS